MLSKRSWRRPAATGRAPAERRRRRFATVAVTFCGERCRRHAIEALIGAKNQETAADALADAEWTVAGSEVRVQTELSKTMLPMVINRRGGEADQGCAARCRSRWR